MLKAKQTTTSGVRSPARLRRRGQCERGSLNQARVGGRGGASGQQGSELGPACLGEGAVSRGRARRSPFGVPLNTPRPKGQGHCHQVSAKVSALPRAAHHRKALRRPSMGQQVPGNQSLKHGKGRGGGGGWGGGANGSLNGAPTE